MTSSVEIIYEEGPVLAVNKPSGLLTQAGTGIDSMELRVKQTDRASRSEDRQCLSRSSSSF